MCAKSYLLPVESTEEIKDVELRFMEVRLLGTLVKSAVYGLGPAGSAEGRAGLASGTAAESAGGQAVVGDVSAVAAAKAAATGRCRSILFVLSAIIPFTPL